LATRLELYGTPTSPLLLAQVKVRGGGGEVIRLNPASESAEFASNVNTTELVIENGSLDGPGPIKVIAPDDASTGPIVPTVVPVPNGTLVVST
jgi:hypothetical protein